MKNQEVLLSFYLKMRGGEVEGRKVSRNKGGPSIDSLEKVLEYMDATIWSK